MRFETEDALRRFLNPFRRLNAKRAEIYGWNVDEIQAEFDEEISLNRALVASRRLGKDQGSPRKRPAARRFDREADALKEQARANTRP